ncbi:MAG: hypothetical protein ACP5NZ_00055 [Nanobdellota archaeon]
MNLVDELTKKQANKFQVNLLNMGKFVKQTIAQNKEGIFYLSSGLNERADKIIEAMRESYPAYDFALNKMPANYEIMFRKKTEEVNN